MHAEIMRVYKKFRGSVTQGLLTTWMVCSERLTRNENLYVPRFMRGIQTNGPSQSEPLKHHPFWIPRIKRGT